MKKEKNIKMTNLVIDENNYAFIFGAFGTIELLKKKKSQVVAIIVDPSFLKNEAFTLIKTLIDNDKIIIDKKLIDKIKDKGNIFVVGVFKKYKMNLETNKHLILKGTFESGKIGTIIRSMNGFEMKDLVLINKNIDIYSKHLLRSSMGAFFNINIVQFDSIEEYINKYPQNKIYYVTNKGIEIKNFQLKESFSLLFCDKDEENKFNKIKFDKDIPLENIINIILFNLYK